MLSPILLGWGWGFSLSVLLRCPSGGPLPQVDLDSLDLLMSCLHPSFHLSQSVSPCLTHHLSILQDNRQVILGHSPSWTSPSHTQVETQGTGLLTGFCLGFLLLHGRQQLQKHCQLTHQTSHLLLSSLSSGVRKMEMAL